MSIVKRRYAIGSLLALVMAAVPMVLTAAPAYAGTHCESLPGPTPSVEVDLDDDGNPEVRVPSLSNVSVCAQTDVFVDADPVQVGPCAEWFEAGCYRIYVHVEAGVSLEGGLTLCRSIDGAPTCSRVGVGPWTYSTPEMNRICIGVDARGGSPCSHGDLIGFVE